MRRRVPLWAFLGGVLLVVFAAGGFLVAASGIIPIKASSGHWAITEWLLQFGKRRSIATHTLGMKLPPLEQPWLVLKGAGHYESGCRPCHGSPDLRNPRIAAAMTPRPPDLSALAAARKPNELFYVVKHGIKFTGMPAWPTQERDDEVHAMVAFLLELPKLDADSYRRLVDGTAPRTGAIAPLRDLPELPREPRAVTASCARCHGVDGRGRDLPAFPKLAGQAREYLIGALRAYAERRRHSGIMEPIAVALGPDEQRELADYYSSRPLEASPSLDMKRPANHSSVARGEEIANRGIPRQGVPSCKDCHGPGPHRRNAAYPHLAGQYADFLVLQLQLFHEGRRGGSPYAHIMSHVATRLSPEQMRDVASYYESLPSNSERTTR